MAFYQVRFEQKIPASLEQIWDFVSSPMNLAEITPPHMRFRVTNEELPEKMYPGMIITYTLRPLLGISIAWMTEITQVEKLRYFVDEQRVGPYKLWHHQHFLEEIDGGVLMRDIVTYQPPLSILGKMANRWFIRRELQKIFSFRRLAVEERFGSWSDL